VRDLAKRPIPSPKKRLLDLADKYDVKAGKPTRVSRIIEWARTAGPERAAAGGWRRAPLGSGRSPRLRPLGLGRSVRPTHFRGPLDQSVSAVCSKDREKLENLFRWYIGCGRQIQFAYYSSG
jgi:hypothetical protein